MRIAGVIEGRGYIGSTVEAVLVGHRQFGEIGLLALENDLLHRRLAVGQLSQRKGFAQAFHDHADQALLVGPETGGQALAAAHHIGDDLGFFGSRLAKQHGLGLAMQMGRGFGQLDRLVDDLELVQFRQILNEVAQAETVQHIAGTPGFASSSRGLFHAVAIRPC